VLKKDVFNYLAPTTLSKGAKQSGMLAFFGSFVRVSGGLSLANPYKTKASMHANAKRIAWACVDILAMDTTQNLECFG
jgi:hypothetical protein